MQFAATVIRGLHQFALPLTQLLYCVAQRLNTRFDAVELLGCGFVLHQHGGNTLFKFADRQIVDVGQRAFTLCRQPPQLIFKLFDAGALNLGFFAGIARLGVELVPVFLPILHGQIGALQCRGGGVLTLTRNHQLRLKLGNLLFELFNLLLIALEMRRQLTRAALCLIQFAALTLTHFACMRNGLFKSAHFSA